MLVLYFLHKLGANMESYWSFTFWDNQIDDWVTVAVCKIEFWFDGSATIHDGLFAYEISREEFRAGEFNWMGGYEIFSF